MENASKALIMAATVLLGVMIASVAIALFGMFSRYSENTQNELASKQIGEYNDRFLRYTSNVRSNDRYDDRLKNGVALTAHDVVTLANLARENNKNYQMYESGITKSQWESDSTHYVKIKVIDKDRTYDFFENLESTSNYTYADFIENNSIIVKVNSATGAREATTKNYICYSNDIVLSSETKTVKSMTIRVLE